MTCIETISESRPNRVTNQGTPAAGMKTPRSNVGSSSRSASMSRTAWSQARSTAVVRGARARTRRQVAGPGRSTGRARRARCRPAWPAAGRALGHGQPAEAGVPDALRRRSRRRRRAARWRTAAAVRPGRPSRTSSRSEVAVVVDGPQLAARAEPAGVEAAAPDELARLDVEDVGEVRRDLDLDRQPDRPPAVVDDVEVLVDAAGHRPVERGSTGEWRGDRTDVVEQLRRS